VIRRAIALLVIAYALGLAGFLLMLPRAAAPTSADGIVVLTGGRGRLQQGLKHLTAGRAKRLLVSGVDQSVRRKEFEFAYRVPAKLSACCIDLGKDAVDTISNAQETAAWVSQNKFDSVILVTTDWHMRRAQFEMERALGGEVDVVGDAVKSDARLWTLFKEYNKYLARRISVLFGA
jgi:uncharacterized SAM-binding protein YcdF (DUF218 family)